MPEFRRLVDSRCELGEGPLWDDRVGLFRWLDIEGRALHEAAPDGSRYLTRPMPERPCSMGLCESGRLVVALPKRVVLFDLETGTIEPVADLEPDLPTTRLNDGKVGPDGAFWVGSMDERPERAPIGSLYRIAPDGRVDRMIAGLRVSNGLAWSADGRTLYLADSRGPWIDRIAFDPATGSLGERVRMATLDDATGRPDGGATDLDGNYWSAGVTAGRLNRFDRDGHLAESFDLPVAAPTMPCFGGPERDLILVTSLSASVAPDRIAGKPWTGSPILFSPGTYGVPVGRFADRK
jgi:sugar lactone lactonase YvrE